MAIDNIDFFITYNFSQSYTLFPYTPNAYCPLKQPHCPVWLRIDDMRGIYNADSPTASCPTAEAAG